MPPVNCYTDYNGRRVLVRNVGPPGKGVPAGGEAGQIYVKASDADFDGEWANSPAGTNAAVGPASSVNGNVVLFDGTTGKLLKDSTRSVSYFSTKSYADTKVDKITGKDLSTEDFTTELKDKLEALSTGGFRGVFAVVEDIEAIESAMEGDRAYLEVTGDAVVEYLWDSTNEVWTAQTLDPVDMTGQEIADVLFESTDAATWDVTTCRIFTSTEKAQVANHEALLTATLGGGSGFQPQDATLTAFAGLVNVADKLPYFTGVDTMAVITFTSAGRAVISAATAADQRTTLGIGTTDTPQLAGIKITSGSTARGGNATLAVGTVTVNNSAVTVNTVVIHSVKTLGGTPGTVSYVVNAGVSIVFTSSNVADTSVLSYFWFDTI